MFLIFASFIDIFDVVLSYALFFMYVYMFLKLRRIVILNYYFI